MKIYIFLILLICKPTISKAQYNNDFQAGISNVVFGGIVGGIGAVINKDKSAKTGNTFLKGFYKGASGGLLIYGSKALIKTSAKNLNSNYWSAKIMNSTGVSMIENAVSNRSIVEKVHINIGFNRFDFYTKQNFKVQYRVLPLSFISSVYHFSKYRFDLKTTLKTGTFFFYTKENQPYIAPGGTNMNNVFLDYYLKSINSSSLPYLQERKLTTIKHEMIHVFQYETLFSFNGYLDKPLKKIELKSKFFSKLNKYLYPEYGQTIILLFKRNKQSGFIEKEARFYANQE